MWPDRVSNPGPLTYESGALPTALRGPAACVENKSSGICSCKYSSVYVIALLLKTCMLKNGIQLVVVVALLVYVHGKHLRSRREGQLT